MVENIDSPRPGGPVPNLDHLSEVKKEVIEVAVKAREQSTIGKAGPIDPNRVRIDTTAARATGDVVDAANSVMRNIQGPA